MAQNIEIEFKNMLTKAQYEMLLQKFNVTADQIHHQTNHYFDTPQGHLKNLSSGLRIRQIGQYFECTLKEKTSEHGHLETTEEITIEQANDFINGSLLPCKSIAQRLNENNVPFHHLYLFGSLETNRVEIEYNGGLLVFDHSHYLQQDDYEVEYETTNEIEGEKVFNDFLKAFEIEKHTAPKKIARFMAALRKKGTL